MNSINVNIPVVNMPQVGHQMADAHRAPMVHQAQNADHTRDRLDLQVRTAQEAEHAEGKIIDPNAKREEKRQGKKREGGDDDAESGEENQNKNRPAVALTDGGHIIDLEA